MLNNCRNEKLTLLASVQCTAPSKMCDDNNLTN